MAADVLAMLGSRASATMIFTLLNWDNLILACYVSNLLVPGRWAATYAVDSSLPGQNGPNSAGIGWDNRLALYMSQAIIWANAILMHICIYASLGVNGLKQLKKANIIKVSSVAADVLVSLSARASQGTMMTKIRSLML